MWPFKRKKKHQLDQLVEGSEQVLRLGVNRKHITPVIRLALAVDGCTRMTETLVVRWMRNESLSQSWLSRPLDDPDRLAVNCEISALTLHIVNRIAFASYGDEVSGELQKELVRRLITYIVEPSALSFSQLTKVRNWDELTERENSFVDTVNSAEVEYTEVLKNNPMLAELAEFSGRGRSLVTIPLLETLANRIVTHTSMSEIDDGLISPIDVLLIHNWWDNLATYTRSASEFVR